jgi:hypothetical protein
MWLDSPDRNYDLVLVYYGDDDDIYDNMLKDAENDNSIHVYKRKGFKWQNFNWYLDENDVEYRYIWVTDDDIETDTMNINRMFETLELYPNIMIGLPSTTPRSVTSGGGRRVDKHRCNVLLEYKNFLENGFVVFKNDMFSNEFFRKVLSLTNTGYYFDLLMKYCFDEKDRETTQAILHNVVVTHPKRTGQSEIDKVLPRGKHPSDYNYFVRGGIPKHMLKYSDVRYTFVNNDDKCEVCNK